MTTYHRLIIVLWATIILLTSVQNVEGQEFNIDYLTVSDGLSQNEVTSIVKDDFGFMWFGTRGGLNRYDGYEFIHYKPNRKDKNMLRNPSIERLLKKKDGDLLIGTKSAGYTVFNQSTQQFLVENTLEDIGHNRVISFCEDVDNNLWVGSWSNGLKLIPEKKDTVLSYLGKRRVYSMANTPDGLLWYGGAETFGYVTPDKKNRPINLGKHFEVTKMIYDEQQNCLWIIGWGLGIVKYDCNNFTYKHIPLVHKGKTINGYSLLKGKDGIIWIGTWGNGVFTYSEATSTLKQQIIQEANVNRFNNELDVVLDIFQDEVGSIWLGTHAGVVKLSFDDKFDKLTEFAGNRIMSLTQDAEGKLWIAGSKGILKMHDKQLESVEIVLNGNKILPEINPRVQYEDDHLFLCLNRDMFVVEKEENDVVSIKNFGKKFNVKNYIKLRKVRDVCSRNSDLWIGTQQQGLFLYKKDDRGYKFRQHFTSSIAEGTLKDNRISSLFYDKDEELWVSTYKGLFRFNPQDSSFVSIDDLLVSNKLICDIVLCTGVDSDNNIWFGTPSGLNKLIRKNKDHYILREYNRDSGMTDDYIYSIIIDEDDILWIATNAGISRLNPKTNEFWNFDETDGISEGGFGENVSLKTNNGKIYFGGKQGLTVFKPKQVTVNEYHPPLVITNLSILNKPVQINSDGGVLTDNINNTKKIVLSHKKTEFSFGISSLDYKAPNRNLYAYKLEGYNDEWINIGNRRHVSFSNLKPGNYNLEIKGSNSNGNWSNKTYKLDIEVKPAPWRTWYAVVLYVLIIVAVTFLINQVAVRQERLENSIKVERFKRTQENELSEYKFRFFTNISHELRTPLTLILAPINELISKDMSSISLNALRTKHRLIYQNANRLYKLINQLLEFRRMEAGKLKLEAEEIDFKNFINKIYSSFEELALSKSISLDIECVGEDWKCYADTDKLTTIVNNLLSNAFKYSGIPGEVKVLCNASDDTVCFQVSNNGKGIPKDEIDNLFKRFYQAGNTHSPGSSGIGLALVKNFIELHKGEIYVESIPDGITTFFVVIKKGQSHLLKDEIRVSDIESKNLINEAVCLLPVKTKSANTGTKGATVVVVEDNDEVRSYIVDLLGELYQVIEAVNGLEGYEMVIEHKPLAVISDVMMPVMDGFELCEKIKSNDITSHIPIVLLTAKGTSQDQLFGARKGADLYLTKPFDPELLIEKIKILISSRTKLSDKYSQKVILAPEDAEITSAEAKFLQSTIKIIEDHMEEANFDADKLAKEMAMSPSTFYRKTKKLTKKTPGEFIKHIRMQRAGQLLKESDLSVSEISEAIGYSDIKSFRKVFKNVHGLTPSDYRSKA